MMFSKVTVFSIRKITNLEINDSRKELEVINWTQHPGPVARPGHTVTNMDVEKQLQQISAKNLFEGQLL